MKKICLMIPTQNRDEAIDFYLDNKLLIFSQKNIDVVICDSSNNELTKRCVERFWEKGFNNLYYSFYANDGSDLLGGNKLYHALNEYKEKYEYIWLSGDTTVIDIERIYDDVESGVMQECDFIHIYRNSYGMQTQYISDCNVFFRYFAWSMTHCCSYILSQKIVDQVLCYVDSLEGKNVSFMFGDAIYEYIAFNQFNALYIKDNLFQVSPYRTKSTVHLQKRILEVWGKDWCEEIDALPVVYSNNKEFVKKSLSENIGLFSYMGVMSLRADGNITKDAVKQYECYINQVTNTPIVWFKFCCLIPEKVADYYVNFYMRILNALIKAKNKLMK